MSVTYNQEQCSRVKYSTLLGAYLQERYIVDKNHKIS